MVNNAGVWYAAELEMTPDHLFKRVMDVNLMGAVAVTKAFMPLLRQAKGRIVNMTSVAGEFILSMVRQWFGVQNGKNLIGLYKENTFYEQWH